MKRKLMQLATNFLILAIVLLIGIKMVELYQVSQAFQRLNSSLSYDSLNITNLSYDDVPVLETLDSSKYVIIDVREPVEYMGLHLEGAINIRLGDIFRDDKTLEYLRNLSQERTLALYCYQNKYSEVGDGRSGLVAQYLLANNISAKVITGGISGIPRNLGLLNRDGDFIIDDIEKTMIRSADTTCVLNLVGNVVKLEKHNETLKISADVVYLTSEEWKRLLDFSGQETCHVVCDNLGSCYYGNIFGLNLEMQGGKYEGHVLV